MKRTYQPRQKEVKRERQVIDAKGRVLGRLATEVAGLLMGKHKRTYAYQMDMGDAVQVINAEKVIVSGRKEKQKVYYKHSGYPGGFKEVKYSKLKKEQPEKIIRMAVAGMLPDNRLKDERLARLQIWRGENSGKEEKE